MAIFRKHERVGTPLAAGAMVLLAGIIAGPLGALAVSGVAVGTVAKIRKKRLGHADTKTKVGEAYSLLTNVASPLVTGSITAGDILNTAVGEVGSSLAARGQKRRRSYTESQNSGLDIDYLLTRNEVSWNRYRESDIWRQTQEMETAFFSIPTYKPKDVISVDLPRIEPKKCPKCGLYSPSTAKTCIYCARTI